MQLAVGGWLPRRHKWKLEWTKYIRKVAVKLLADHPRIKTIRVTFTKDDPNWDLGFSWLVRYNQVEIIVPERFDTGGKVKWVLLHELFHARQILEKRLNKDLDRLKFTNRLGNTQTFTSRKGEGYYGEFWCKETGKRVHNQEPWEKEVNGDINRLQRRNGVPRSRKSRS